MIITKLNIVDGHTAGSNRSKAARSAGRSQAKADKQYGGSVVRFFHNQGKGG